MKAADLVGLRERIALCKDFSAVERDLILDCLALNDYSSKHAYPPGNGPGTNKWNTLAWALLDQLPPDAMKRNHRFQLGAMIAGAMQQLQLLGKKG